VSLREYRRKRHFAKTPEPRGQRAGQKSNTHRKLSFVVHKHDASHLHYDFRLEHNGVLKSWAVPKGPDLDPANKRLAMQVEDHPREYGDFEGVIPPGEYGGGTVLLWDKGTWEPLGDAEQGFEEGHLKFILHGEKLRGGWMLVRKGGAQSEASERRWFLFKERDEFARPGGSITEEMPLSVTTGRDLAEIAAQSDRVWGPGGEVKQNGQERSKSTKSRSKKTSRSKKIPSRPKRRAKPASNGAASASRQAARLATNGSAGAYRANETAGSSLSELLAHPSVRRGAMPKAPKVELATLVDAAPTGDEWLHEIKFDGYRMLCRVMKGKARFISRKGQDWTSKFPELADAASRLAVKEAMLDGEVVSLTPDGTSSFQALQNVFRTGRTDALAYYLFDILYLDGYDLTEAPLEVRRNILSRVLAGAPGKIRLSDSIQGSGRDVMAKACSLKLEGIVSKRRNSTYQPGRWLDWLKVKCSQRSEFVIGGFTKPTGGRSHFGALLLGYYDHARKLIYAGRVGTGFDAETLATIHQKLKRLVQPKSPFVTRSGATGRTGGVEWVKPELVAEIEFSNWTDAGILRHASFQGLREDKPAGNVFHESPISVSEADARKNGRKSVGSPADDSRQADAKAPAPRRAATDSRPVGTGNAIGDAHGEFAGVRLSHPDKILYPAQGITKRALADYYLQVADWMLPHVIDRPLAIVRCPEGSNKPCFFQKHPGDDVAWKHLRKVDISQDGEPEYNLAIHDVSGLISLVQMGVLEIHVWGSLAAKLEKPDRLVFDLDPDPSVEWLQVTGAARQLRDLLEELGLTAFVKTTGGRGLHVVVPVQPRTVWDEAKAFCRSVANLMVKAAPDRFIATASKAARKGKIFIDYLRNGRGATSVAPYSTRSKPGATVSAPITWEELTPGLKSDHFTIENLPARLSRLKQDPWAEMPKVRQSITAAIVKRLGKYGQT
jgi:bifunctional non-homologous end joining protein LigD